MAKLNSIGVKAEKIDRIFANAIAKIANGKQEFSCCAISTLSEHERDALIIREFYTDVLDPRPSAKLPLSLLLRVMNHVGYDNTDKSQGFRILMLSLIKAAWRDLV